jgi:isocitrate dehydrogenase
VKVGSRQVTGVDVFIESSLQPADLGEALNEAIAGTTVNLQMIGNRGNTVFPAENERPVTLVDQYRCRFMKKDRNDNLSNAEILALLTRVGEEHVWMHVEKLQQFNDVDAFSRTHK